MYIIAIAWLYVTVLMAATESSITAGVLTFVFYGLLPCALFIWVFGTPQRNRQRQKKQSILQNATQTDSQTDTAAQLSDNSTLENVLGQPDRPDSKHD